MVPVLFRSARRIAESDIRALAEYLGSAEPIEAQLHRVLEAHPPIIGALGFHEFVSEFPISKRDRANNLLIDPRFSDRVDILAARLDVAMDLRAKKFANVIELKGARARILDRRGRRSSILSAAVNQVRDYSRVLSEESNREVLSKFGWEVWRPTRIVIMGSRAEFRDPGQLEQLKQELLETDGVRLLLTDELLALAEMERRRPESSVEDLLPIEGLFGMHSHDRFWAPLIVASSGLAGFMLAGRRLKEVTTSYGNVDIREGVPEGLVHIAELRLQPLARKLGVPFAEAVVGFNKFRRGYVQMYGPIKSGIVVAEFDADVVRSAFEQRELRNRPLRERVRARRWQKREHEQSQRIRVFADSVKRMFPRLSESMAESIATRATEPGSGRVGTNSSLRLEEATWLAVAAYAAYGHLGLTSREAAHRSQKEVVTVLCSWGGPRPENVSNSPRR